MKFVVTGAAGFIGSHVSRALLEQGHVVYGLDNLDPYYSLQLKEYNLDQLRSFPEFSFQQADIRNEAEIDALISQWKPDIIIHLAAKAGVRRSMEEPQEYFAVNVQGTLNILEAARKANVKKILAASSSSVYGDNQIIPFSEENDVPSQVSPYAASKRAMEVLCSSYARIYKLPIQMFRFFTVYGPSGRPDMAIAIFTKAIMNDEPLPVFGDTNSERDYTYITDIVSGILGAIDRDEEFSIYNLGNNTPQSLQELIEAIELATGKKAKLQVTDRQQGDVLRTWADIQKAQQYLGYSPQTSLKQGIQNFVDWYRGHQDLYQ